MIICDSNLVCKSWGRIRHSEYFQTGQDFAFMWYGEKKSETYGICLPEMIETANSIM